MGKEGELWDDSVLITAFDQAISKYKVFSTSLQEQILLIVYNYCINQFIIAENARKRVQGNSKYWCCGSQY